MKRAIKLGLALVMVILSVVIVITSCAPKAAPTTEAPKAPVAPAPEAAPGKVWKLKYATVAATGTLAWEYTYGNFKREIEEKSGGRIIIEYYPSDSLVKIADALEATRLGITDIAYIWGGREQQTLPLEEVFNQPFITETSYQTTRIWRKPEIFDKYFRPYYEAYGVQFIGVLDCAMLYLYTMKEPIYTLDQLTKSPMTFSAITSGTMDLALSWGVTALGLHYAEFYEAMQKGTIDAISTSPATMSRMKYYELGKPGYFIDVGGLPCGPVNRVMNQKVWNSLPSDLQQLILDLDWKIFIDEQWIEVGKEFDAGYAEMEKFGTVQIVWDAVQKERMRKEHFDKMWTNWAATADAKGLPGTQLVEDIKALVPWAKENFPPPAWAGDRRW